MPLIFYNTIKQLEELDYNDSIYYDFINEESNLENGLRFNNDINDDLIANKVSLKCITIDEYDDESDNEF